MRPSAWTRLGPAGLDHGPKLLASSRVARRLVPGLRLRSCPQVSSSTKVLPCVDEPSRRVGNRAVAAGPRRAPRPQTRRAPGPAVASAGRSTSGVQSRGDERRSPRGPSPAVRAAVRGDDPQGAGRGPRAPARAAERAERSGPGARRGRRRELRLLSSAGHEVVAVEPEPYLHGKAVEAAAAAPVRVTVVDGTADRLPVDGCVRRRRRSPASCCARSPTSQARWPSCTASCGPAVSCASTSTCSRTSAGSRAWQRAVDRLFWPRAFGGCHTARDTPAAIAAAGFAIERQRRLQVGARFVPAATHVLGSARRA